MEKLDKPRKGLDRTGFTQWLWRAVDFINSLRVRGDGKTTRVSRGPGGTTISVINRGGGSRGGSAATSELPTDATDGQGIRYNATDEAWEAYDTSTDTWRPLLGVWTTNAGWVSITDDGNAPNNHYIKLELDSDVFSELGPLTIKDDGITGNHLHADTVANGLKFVNYGTAESPDWRVEVENSEIFGDWRLFQATATDGGYALRLTASEEHAMGDTAIVYGQGLAFVRGHYGVDDQTDETQSGLTILKDSKTIDFAPNATQTYLKALEVKGFADAAGLTSPRKKADGTGIEWVTHQELPTPVAGKILVGNADGTAYELIELVGSADV